MVFIPVVIKHITNSLDYNKLQRNQNFTPALQYKHVLLYVNFIKYSVAHFITIIIIVIKMSTFPFGIFTMLASMKSQYFHHF